MKVPGLQTFGWAICALVICVCGAARTTHAQGYTFVNVADTTGPLEFFALPSINNAGQVAFHARKDRPALGAPVYAGIYRGSAGGGVTTIAEYDATFTRFGPSVGPWATPVIDPGGRVYFYGTHATLGKGVFAGTGSAPPVSIEDAATSAWNDFGDPVVNSSGVSAFRADTDAGFSLVRNDGTATTVVKGGIFWGAINDLGQVTYRQPLPSPDGHSIDVWTPNPSGDGGTIEAKFRHADGPPYIYYETPVINDDGLLAFRALYGTVPGDKMAIATGKGGSFTTIADTDGPYKDFVKTDGYHGLSLNDAGEVAFFANLDAPGGHGIFTGPDPVADAVIRGSDPLFGSTVREVRIYTNSLNESGQIAFRYVLGNDVSGIAIATPVPEPASLSLLAAGCAAFLRRRR